MLVTVASSTWKLPAVAVTAINPSPAIAPASVSDQLHVFMIVSFPRAKPVRMLSHEETCYASMSLPKKDVLAQGRRSAGTRSRGAVERWMPGRNQLMPHATNLLVIAA